MSLRKRLTTMTENLKSFFILFNNDPKICKAIKDAYNFGYVSATYNMVRIADENLHSLCENKVAHKDDSCSDDNHSI